MESRRVRQHEPHPGSATWRLTVFLASPCLSFPIPNMEMILVPASQDGVGINGDAASPVTLSLLLLSQGPMAWLFFAF